MRYKPFTVNLEPEEVDHVERLADEEGVSASHIVRRAVKGYLSDRGIFVPATLGRNTRRALRNKATEAVS